MGELEASRQSPRILFENEDFWAVDKPSGWLSVPASEQSPNPAPILGRWLERGSGQRVFPVHRLDQETSGVILFAKTPTAQRSLNRSFEQRKVKKTYRFLTDRAAPAPSFRCEAEVEGLPASTKFRAIESWKMGFLGEAMPSTGRRHQIRKHLAALDLPILGDRLYGGLRALPDQTPILRSLLHAYALELATGESFTAPIPEDFSEVLERLRNPGKV